MKALSGDMARSSPFIVHSVSFQLYLGDDRDKSPTPEELEILLRAAGGGLGPGASSINTGKIGVSIIEK